MVSIYPEVFNTKGFVYIIEKKLFLVQFWYYVIATSL